MNRTRQGWNPECKRYFQSKTRKINHRSTSKDKKKEEKEQQEVKT
jgi:hypothetical protein